MKSAVAVLLALMLLLAVCAGCASDNMVEASDPKVVEVGSIGLLGFESPAPDMFTFEIMPDADNQIYQIIMDYKSGTDEGTQVFVPANGGAFTRDTVILKAFERPHVDDGETLPPMTLSFSFADAEGDVQSAENKYTVETPIFRSRYFVKITGSRAQGYVLR